MFLLVIFVLGCTPDEPMKPDPSAEAPPLEPSDVEVVSRVQLPSTLLPHCLHGLDPHNLAVNPDTPGGYGISLMPRYDLLRFMGFQRVDIVKSVNGLSLGSAEQWFQARLGVQGATECAWLVRRRDGDILLRGSIMPAEDEPLVLRYEADDSTLLSRSAVWAWLSDPYGGRLLFVAPSQRGGGARVADKTASLLLAGLYPGSKVAVLAIGESQVNSSKTYQSAMAAMLTESSVTWRLQVDGQKVEHTFHIEGPALEVPAE